MSETGNNGGQSAESLLSELVTLCKSDLLSEDGLSELFKRHGFTPNNHNALAGNLGFFHYACLNLRVTEGIIQCLLEYFPDAASATDVRFGNTPLHFACRNKSTTRGIIQLLIDADPTSVGIVNNKGNMPLHILCASEGASEATLIEVLKVLIEKHPELLVEKQPEAVRHTNNKGHLPIHMAAMAKSPEFLRLLIESYPGSERIGDSDGFLPLHLACYSNTFAAVKYLYKLYPDAINHAATSGSCPIHGAIIGVHQRGRTMETVHYLLDCDSNMKLQKAQGILSLLHFACRGRFNDSNIDAALEVIKTIYDAHPEAIEDGMITSGIRQWHQQVQDFINSERVYARQARDLRLMMTADNNGRLPLHIALQSNLRVGSIKLLVKGNPSAIRSIDDNGALPLHVACQHHDSASVVEYMISLANFTLDTTDREWNTALHYACRGAKYDTISLLLDKFDAVSISKRNAHGKLPIDLLWESRAVKDRESVEYTECIFRLLKAYPETVMNVCTEVQSASGTYLGQNQSGNGKKRKLGNE